MDPSEPSQDEIDRKPWKYVGYQAFSRFVSSDNDFFVLRRFGALSARVLLRLQDQLTQIEEDLEALETHHRQKEVPDVHNGTFREETLKDREKLIGDAQRLLRKYSKQCYPSDRKEARSFFGIDPVHSENNIVDQWFRC